jgi:hypothetical protein
MVSIVVRVALLYQLHIRVLSAVRQKKSLRFDWYLFRSAVATCPKRHCPWGTQNVTAQEICCIYRCEDVSVLIRAYVYLLKCQNGPGETGPGCVPSDYAPMPGSILLSSADVHTHTHTDTQIHRYTHAHIPQVVPVILGYSPCAQSHTNPSCAHEPGGTNSVE